MWKVRKEEFIAKTIDTVVECALHLQTVMEYFSDGSKSLTKGNRIFCRVNFSINIFKKLRYFWTICNIVREINKKKIVAIYGHEMVASQKNKVFNGRGEDNYMLN